jgi:hypothetical protein
MEHDPEIEALKRANRRPLWVGLGVVGGAVVAAGLWVSGGAGAVRAALEADGHTDVEVKLVSPFEYGYQSKKGSMVCGGYFRRLPFSTSHQGSCFGAGPRPKTAPARPQNEVLAEQLRTRFPKLPITGARCPKIEAGAKLVTCTLEADAGAPLDLELENSDGEWKIKSPQRILTRATFADALAEELHRKAGAPVAVDCGAGLFGYSENDHLTCTATRKNAKKAGSVDITFGAEGSYTWKATGI